MGILRRTRAALVAAVAALLAGLGARCAAAEAAYAGEQVCLGCHGQENRHYRDTVHARAFRLNPQDDDQRRVCEACHGPGAEHARRPTDRRLLIGFTRGWGTPVETQNGQCLKCHDDGNRMHWEGSVHASRRLGCADCHNPMERISAGGLLRLAGIAETCYACHLQERAEFRRNSHMPLPEAKISCADCHNPHGSTARGMLKADSVNELCYGCHAEKRGPYLWEHAPVSENCLNCHEQHGSNHDMLLRQPRPMICTSCHNWIGVMGQTHRHPAAGAPIQILGRSCQNCHSQIHGSNSPDGARLRR